MAKIPIMNIPKNKNSEVTCPNLSVPCLIRKLGQAVLPQLPQAILAQPEPAAAATAAAVAVTRAVK